MILNPFLASLKRRYALRRGELLSIYVMFLLLVPASVMIKWLVSYLTGVT